MLEQVMSGVLIMSVGWAGVMGWCGCVALLVVDGLFMVGLEMVAVGRWLCGLLWVVGVLVGSGLVSVAVLQWRMYCRMLVVGLRR